MENIKAHRELVSIFQRGSWYQVCLVEANTQGGRRLRTFTVQGVHNTRKYCQYYKIVHTKGDPYAVSLGINLKFFLENGWLIHYYGIYYVCKLRKGDLNYKFNK